MQTRKFAIALSGALLTVATGASAALFTCKECGTVTDVKSVQHQGQGSGLGAVIGGVAGGVLGHQIGAGRGKDVATVAGAAGGAYAGNEIEKTRKTTTSYVVYIKMEDGTNRDFTFSKPTSYRAGDKVKVIDGKLVRQ